MIFFCTKAWRIWRRINDFLPFFFHSSIVCVITSLEMREKSYLRATVAACGRFFRMVFCAIIRMIYCLSNRWLIFQFEMILRYFLHIVIFLRLLSTILLLLNRYWKETGARWGVDNSLTFARTISCVYYKKDYASLNLCTSRICFLIKRDIIYNSFVEKLVKLPPTELHALYVAPVLSRG